MKILQWEKYKNRNIISEFQITMGYGTEYTIDYNNGTSETVKVDDDSYTDQYGNTVQYIYRRKDDNSVRNISIMIRNQPETIPFSFA